MMAFEQRDNSGALFKNKKKMPGDNKPDYTGNGVVNGQAVDIAAWIKKANSGMVFMSLSFKPPRQQQQQDEYPGEQEPYPKRQVPPEAVRPQRPTAPAPKESDDSLPF